MNKAVYAGSFDPITNGHLWMIEEGARLFGTLVVAIGTNPDKTYTFDLESRLEMLRGCIHHLDNVTVDVFENQYLVNYAQEIHARYILRGVRDSKDYAYERGMRHINADLQPAITTSFLIPPRELAEVSSSFVKGLIGPVGWQDVVKRYVPQHVYREILARYGSD